MIRRSLHLAATLTLCLLPLAACNSDDTEQTSQPSAASPSSTLSLPSTPVLGEGSFTTPTTANRTNVDSTAETAALMLHSWDTTTDRTQTAAAIRAKPLMSQEWAAHQIEPERNGNQAHWLAAAEHDAYSAPSIVPAVGDTSRDVAADKAIRAYDITWGWVSRDGEEVDVTGRRHLTLYLEKHNGQWDVVGHQSQNMGEST